MGTERIDPIGAPSPRPSEKVPSYRTGDSPGDEAACRDVLLPDWEQLLGFLTHLDCGTAAWRTLALGLLTLTLRRVRFSGLACLQLSSRPQGHSVTWGHALHLQAPAWPRAVGLPVPEVLTGPLKDRNSLSTTSSEKGGCRATRLMKRFRALLRASMNSLSAEDRTVTRQPGACPPHRTVPGKELRAPRGGEHSQRRPSPHALR